MSVIKVDLVSADRRIDSTSALFVAATAVGGEIGIYPRHAPLLAFLKPGEVRVLKPDQTWEYFYISGGMIEVQSRRHDETWVTLLADTAERAKDLDEAKALESIRHAEQLLQDRQADLDYAKARAELIQASAMLRAIRNLRRHTSG